MPHSKHVSMSAPKPAGAPKAAGVEGGSAEKAGTKMHKRSRSGCFTCRLRRKKCDEGHPTCTACAKLCLKCEYKRPMWWASTEQRRQQKERVKNIIKQTKILERRGSNQEHTERARLPSTAPSLAFEYDFNYQPILDPYNPFVGQIQTPAFPPDCYPQQYTPYEVDVRMERQTFVNDVPFRHDSSVSTFNAMGPPQLQTTLPNFHGDDWLQEDCFNRAASCTQNPAPALKVEASSNGVHTVSLPVAEHEKPLLQHFIENVMCMFFPILEANQQEPTQQEPTQQEPTRADAILHSLKNNPSYLECCLGVAVTHKSSISPSDKQSLHNPWQYRWNTIGLLSDDHMLDMNHERVFDTTLAMIFFDSSVGAPKPPAPASEDSSVGAPDVFSVANPEVFTVGVPEPVTVGVLDVSKLDIPWNEHFQGVTNMIKRWDPPHQDDGFTNFSAVSPFNMMLTTWIDILGATMLGRRPRFANTYRDKLVNKVACGLRDQMGCDDRIMYLISEIACLDFHKSEGLDHEILRGLASRLAGELDDIERADPTVVQPCVVEEASLPGQPVKETFLPGQLVKTITAIFRYAARIYLYSLDPGFDRDQEMIVQLVDSITYALQFIPGGPSGFDRSIVWPLLIAGSFSLPDSDFRTALKARKDALGEIGKSGSFGRMCQVVHEVWEPSTPACTAPGVLPPKGQSLHWRDVMNLNKWRYLLI